MPRTHELSNSVKNACEVACHALRISPCSFHFMHVRNQAGSIQCFAAWIKGGCRHLIGCACLGKGSCDFCGLALRVARLGGLHIACVFFTRNINTSNIFRTLNYALIRQLNYLIFLCNPWKIKLPTLPSIRTYIK